MSSYNPGPRIPPNVSFSRQSDASHPGLTSDIIFAPRLPRLQLARPINNNSRSSRGSPLSAVEDNSQPEASSSQSRRQSLLPRPNTTGITSPLSRTPGVKYKTPVQIIPTSLSASDIINPPELAPRHHALPAKQTRNVLRRKAPTIGKHLDSAQSQKLSLVIPQPASVHDMKEFRMQATPELSHSAGPSTSASSNNSSSRTEHSAVETPKTHEPAELASLRTVVENRMNPLSLYPLASSPSTRYSESPGMWSRGSTPTSLSSYSPSIMLPSKIGRPRQPSSPQMKLPFISPQQALSSPQSAQSERSELRTQRAAFPQRSLGYGSSTTTSVLRKPSVTKVPAHYHGPARSPPPRKSSVNFSPPKGAGPSNNSDIDVEKARKEVEQAEREVFNSQRITNESTVPMTPPPRPSRQGTDNLELEASPVIQSNLHFIRSTGHKRRESTERARIVIQANPIPSQSAKASMDSLRSKDLSRIPSRDTSPVLGRKGPRVVTRELSREKVEPKKTATASKRFGIFPKRSKADLEDYAAEQSRSARKGPTAGTGHEGYGKYAQRGRKASASNGNAVRTSSTSTTRSTSRSISSSKESMTSRPELNLDDFLMSRLEPVVINGGGMDGVSLSGTQSEQSISSQSVASSGVLHTTPLSSFMGQSTDSLGGSSTGTLSEADSTPLVLTQSRSPERNQVAQDVSQPWKSRMPVPKDRRNGLIDSAEATVPKSSMPSQNPITVPQESPKKDIQHAKKAKSSRWNIFQKTRTEEPKVPVASSPDPAPETSKLHAAITPVLKKRHIAHYALVDIDSDEFDEILDTLDDSPLTEEEEALKITDIPSGLNIRKKQQSILLPSPPKMYGDFETHNRRSPKVKLYNHNMMSETESSVEAQRPRRLASVGRIPQVVSRRDRQHKPTMQSFSRPFNAESPVTLDTCNFKGQSTGEVSLHHPIANPFSNAPDWSYNPSQTFSAPEQVSALDFLAGPYSSHEFLHFSPSSLSSSSTVAVAAVTAVLPNKGTAPMEDEIWKEYDDLIDTLSPENSKNKQNGSGKADDQGKFELATAASKALQDGLIFQAGPGDKSNRNSDVSVHLRRSVIAPALHSSVYASIPPFFSNNIADHESIDKALSGSSYIPKASPTTAREQSELLSPPAPASITKEKTLDDRKSSFASSERDWDTVTSTNMRSASLMTSRWLSFGRVLFSPAHNHVKEGSRRILVIDGLKNDDWSFYCSLTYPDAEVYSLSGQPSTKISNPAAWQPPTNHHTLYHASLQNPLPFPKDFFAVTVLRFPAASPESIQNNLIQECKRVLCTGGYIELSLLDRDMVNMGVRTGRAVRRLKEMTCLADPAISLKPSSDSIQRLLGTQGFDNLRRCMVCIPVVGVVLRSSSSTTSSSLSPTAAASTTTSIASTLPTISVTATTGSQTKPSSPDDLNIFNVSLGDLLSDPSRSAANDESIAKIVARVGRWWYTKCYEDPVLPDEDNSNRMWNDRRILRECQRQGTGFRMLIAYAQKPSEPKRRTASV
ncbi:hypothetical protein N7495_004377 [Penicillium taxi]|uniref:uncharacterized protein n=1 Tax=Penicillium taxi TaxID=168475 RepID=UPI00254594C8|nr:uncharacterized protein N7495_004377 [Penicillium taxi]KAJ5899633.1 hypothetical protein N7495_004377 [Penicillium taxi]